MLDQQGLPVEDRFGTHALSGWYLIGMVGDELTYFVPEGFVFASV
jgi:hypothetical protein